LRLLRWGLRQLESQAPPVGITAQQEKRDVVPEIVQHTRENRKGGELHRGHEWGKLGSR